MSKSGWRRKSHLFALAFVLISGAVYFFSDPNPQNHYDYTLRVAESFLHGRLGPNETPPRWLNEFIPSGDIYYSAFPLGAVLTMLPVALLTGAGIVNGMPGPVLSAACACFIAIFLLLIADRYEVSTARKVLLSASILFGTWMWVNLTLAGAWQLALGFAMLGEFGAIYVAVFRPMPFVAGLFFAMAFGNRTEILLTAPIFYLLLARSGEKFDRIDTSVLDRWLAFSAVPIALGSMTLLYNYERFDSVFDFGYAKIPGVLNEPWYQHGIFSIFYMPRQAYEMLFKPWNIRDWFPYLIPNGFSGSIIFSSPFLLFVFRSGYRDRILKFCAYAAIAALTLVLWIHGNSGGWQFGYRYAMVLLPWIFIILLENSPKKITAIEYAAYGFSFIANAYALWMFHWTDYVKP